MKILLVNHLLDAVTGGGTAERTYQIGRFLARAGAECTILTLDVGITAERREGLGEAKLVAVPCINERFFIPQLCSAQTSRLVAEADVVQLSGHWTLLNVLVYRACRKLGKPYLFCPAGALQPFGRSLWLKRIYDLSVGHRLTRSAAACVAVTDAERVDFVGCGVSDDRIVVIPNGIDPDAYQIERVPGAVARFRQTVGLGDARFILFLGRLNLIKGPDLLLDAFCSLNSDLPDVHLVIAGPDGGMLSQLKEIAAARGITRQVHFTGYLGSAEKLAALHAATLLAIPSRREAMSIVVLEGGICGCPVLFTDACGIDGIAHAGAGVMVPASASALAEALLRMLRDPESMRASAERLQDIVQQNYLWEVQAQRYLTVSSQISGGAIRLAPFA
jgi:glycosyltransferase involved in cell wall biosynthesis